MNDEGHLFNRLAHVVAVRVTAVAAIEEQDIKVALFHCHAQAAEVHFGFVQRAKQGVHEFVVSAGLAALHGHDALAGMKKVIGHGLEENERAHGLDAVGVARERAPEPQNGARAFRQSGVEGKGVMRRNAGNFLNFFRRIG